MNAERLSGRVVAVTGAAAGIGLACVHRYLEEGASVVAADRDGEGLEALAAQASGPLHTMMLDVTEEGTSQAIVDAAIGEFGGLDVFHANAGGAIPTPFEAVEDPLYQTVIALNLDAVWQAARSSVPVFLERGAGVFLVTSSGAGINAVRGLAAYGAAKAGVQSLVKTLALEYGRRGIRACAIAPGPIESPGLLAWLDTQPGGVEAHVAHKPMGRLGRPSEIAAAAAFLASDDASFINGVTLPVDGGTQATL